MSEIYRDPSEGAKARREDLLRHRRDELAEMPHALRRVVVARAARVGAAAAAIAVGGALIALACLPTVAADLSHALPGRPAVLTALLAIAWGATAFAWWVARARVEHRYAIEMSRLVRRSADLDVDLQRLDHERPDDASRAMALRLERRAVALPVLAAAMLVPATAVYGFALAQAGTWPQLAHVEERLGAHADAYVVLAALGALAALVGTRLARRANAATRLGALGVALGCVAVPTAFDGPGWLSWLLLGTGASAAAIGWGARRLAVERAAIRVDGAVELRELTLADLAHAIRRAIAACGRGMRSHRHATMLAICAASILCGWRATRHATRVEEREPRAFAPDAHGHADTDQVAMEPLAHLARQSDGRVRVDATVPTVAMNVDDTVASPLADLPRVPAGWHLSLAIDGDAGLDGISVRASATAPAVALHGGHTTVLELDACTDEPAIELRFSSATRPGATVTAYVTPTLRLASCP